MKGKFIFSNLAVIFLSISFIIFILNSCAPSKPSLKTLSITEPERVVSKEDSLLAVSKEKRPEFVSILSTAHINIARKAEKSGDIKTALDEYKKVLAIDPKNKIARYESLILQGLSLYKKGSKTSLWDAIELFSKASMINQDNGIASYWIAKSYEKKDSKDYDLIIEAYEDSLSKTLPDKLRNDAEVSKAEANKKKKTFDSFWK